jgi:DNA-directed RNA polymerase II subunit RPB1
MNDDMIKEMYISVAMGGARDMGMAIAKNSLQDTNSFVRTVTSGAKGDYFNISQIAGLLGQQMLNGKRIPLCLSGGSRSLPHYPMHKKDYSDDLLFESQGFIRGSFLRGLSPREFYLHSMTGREGITDTAMKTATSGYIQRRMIKIAEDIQIKYDGTVRNSQNAIIQFMYGIDPSKGILRNNELLPCDVCHTIESLNRSFSSCLEKKSVS